MQNITKVRELVGNKVCLFGNLPPYEVLTRGTPEVIKSETKKLIEKCRNKKGIIISAGGGASPGMPGANLRIMIDTLKSEAI